MQPDARVAAAIAILDDVLDGTPAEVALQRWARGSRFAGSKDRAAVRDLVFGGLRAKRSLAAQGRAQTGRAILSALIARDGENPTTLFNGEGHAPAPLSSAELEHLDATPDMTEAEEADLPNWLWPLWRDALGEKAMPVAQVLRDRAGVFLRVNTRRATRAEARAALAAEGIETVPVPGVKTALQVTVGERKVTSSDVFSGGLVEVQDPASQAAMLRLPLQDGMRVLDFCAGGGGKALAMADLADVAVTAHDIAPARMRDIPARAQRAGVRIATTDGVPPDGAFDLVLCDAPCSGSGTWRRTPEAKWALTPDRLAELQRMQDVVLHDGAKRVGTGGVLAYATCSILPQENGARIAAFCAANPGWRLTDEMNLLPGLLHDGFYLGLLRRD